MPRAKVDFQKITTIYEDQVAASVRQKQMNKIDSNSLSLIQNITSDIRDHIGEVLREGVEHGRSVAATASKLLTTGLDRGVFRSARKRAWAIARTELHRARQLAAMDVYEANNINLVKWIAIGDERLCPICGQYHNKTFQLNHFTKEQLPPRHPFCRCRIIPADFKMDIDVKRSKKGKVVETKLAPNPQDYRYVIRLDNKIKKSDLMRTIITSTAIEGVHLNVNDFDKSDYDYSSTQVELPNIIDAVDQILMKIDPDDFHPKEKAEDVFHITVCYGLETNNADNVRQILEGFCSFRAIFWGVDVFQPEDKDYDVLVARVDAPALWKLHYDLGKLPNNETFPEYKPHMTLCYLKRGTGNKYSDLTTGLEGKEFLISDVVFSPANGEKISIDLKKSLIKANRKKHIEILKSLDVEKSVNVKGFTRTRRGKFETVRPYIKTIASMGRELAKDKKAAAEKFGVEPKYLLYAGLQSMVPYKDEYFHMWTILDEKHPDYKSSKSSGIHYDLPDTIKKEVNWREEVVNLKHTEEAHELGTKITHNQALAIWNKYKLNLVKDENLDLSKLSLKELKEYGDRSYKNQLLREVVETYLGSTEYSLTHDEIEEKLNNYLQKARPYSRIRRGKFESVKGYPHRPRIWDLSPAQRVERALDPQRQDVAISNAVSSEVAAHGGKALIIGGFVRDAVMGKVSKDIDLEVYGIRPDELRTMLDRIGKVDAVGAQFGVFKVTVDGTTVDVSIPRRDNQIGIGHKGFEVEADPNMTTKDAARRRDLTINSIAYDSISKTIIDEYNGLQDIKDRKLRAVDQNTFIEDPLRVLRVMQFAGRFGMVPDVDLIKLCRTVDLTSLPKERLYTEFEKLLLNSKMPSIGLRLMPALGIDKIFPELASLRGVPQDKEWHPEGGLWKHTLLTIDAAAQHRKMFDNKQDKMVYMLSVLCHDMGKPGTTSTNEEGRIISHGHEAAGAEIAGKFLDRITNENDIKERVQMLVGLHMTPTTLHQGKVGNSAVRRLAKKVDIPMLLAVSIADKQGRNIKADLKAERWLMKKYKGLDLANPDTLDAKVKGRNLIPLGVQPGIEMGRLLNRIYEGQLEGKFDTTEGGLEYAREQGWLEKSQVKGFTRTRRGKYELVKPFERKGEKKEFGFHGTTIKFLDKILSEGLRSSKDTGTALYSSGGKYGPPPERYGVYFARNPERSYGIANVAADRFGGNPVVFIAKVNEKEAQTDEDFSTILIGIFKEYQYEKKQMNIDEFREFVKHVPISTYYPENIHNMFDNVSNKKLEHMYNIAQTPNTDEARMLMDKEITSEDSWKIFGSAVFPGDRPENIMGAVTWDISRNAKGEIVGTFEHKKELLDMLKNYDFDAIQHTKDIKFIKNPNFRKAMEQYVLFATSTGLLERIQNESEIEKSHVKGFTRTRRGKYELVNPFERKGKILNPDYLALGSKEFKKLKKQDPSYKYGMYLTPDEYDKLTGKGRDEFEEKVEGGFNYEKWASGSKYKGKIRNDPEQEAAIKQWLSKGPLFIDLKKCRTNLVKLRKSRLDNKKIPYRLNDKIIWAKVTKQGLIIKAKKDGIKYGSKILIKSDIAKITAIGKDGIIARDEKNKKYEILYKNLDKMILN